ncbi:MAG: hypothetical protein Q8Q50_08700 [Methylobacter sp.]|jgi:hypothetical protein|nr:hypothetical protein [Methylobacter sp.]
MSAVALHLYEKLNEASDDKARSKAIVEAFSELEERYPNLREVATQRDLSETELRLQKEIEQTRLEIKTVEMNLQKEIEQTRLEIKTVEANLQKEIKTVEMNLQKEIKTVEMNLQKEIEKTRIEIKQIEVNFSKTVHQQTLWVIGSVGTIVMGVRLLEWFLAHLAL